MSSYLGKTFTKSYAVKKVIQNFGLKLSAYIIKKATQSLTVCTVQEQTFVSSIEAP